MRRAFSTLFMFACIGFSVLGAINVYGDHSVALKKAEEAACGPERGCSPRLRQVAKNPLWIDFDFDVKRKTVPIRCTREFYMFGEPACSERGAR